MQVRSPRRVDVQSLDTVSLHILVCKLYCWWQDVRRTMLWHSSIKNSKMNRKMYPISYFHQLGVTIRLNCWSLQSMPHLLASRLSQRSMPLPIEPVALSSSPIRHYFSSAASFVVMKNRIAKSRQEFGGRLRWHKRSCRKPEAFMCLLSPSSSQCQIIDVDGQCLQHTLWANGLFQAYSLIVCPWSIPWSIHAWFHVIRQTPNLEPLLFCTDLLSLSWHRFLRYTA